MKNMNSGFVIWFTGLSGSGKSTLSESVEDWLSTKGLRPIVLDGDHMRQGLCSDLGFTREDRKENVRRVSEVAKLCADQGACVVVALISPFQADRQQAREIIGDWRFIEIFCDCPLDVCKERDVKGLYRQALSGNVPRFTGISSPYEAPVSPELALKTAVVDKGECLRLIVNAIEKRHVRALIDHPGDFVGASLFRDQGAHGDDLGRGQLPPPIVPTGRPNRP